MAENSLCDNVSKKKQDKGLKNNYITLHLTKYYEKISCLRLTKKKGKQSILNVPYCT